MDIKKFEKALDVDVAYIDRKSLERFTKPQLIKGITDTTSRYKKSELNKKTKGDLLQLYCSLKNFKLVENITHFPGPKN